MDYVEEARKLRPLIEKASQSLSDEDALVAASLYPKWSELVQKGSVEAAAGFKFRNDSDGKLYKCRKENPTFQNDWVPGVGTNALYVRVGENDEAGTLENPIRADRGMEYIYGLYYLDQEVAPEEGNIFLCKRTGESEGGTIVLQFMPHELVGQYFEKAVTA